MRWSLVVLVLKQEWSRNQNLHNIFQVLTYIFKDLWKDIKFHSKTLQGKLILYQDGFSKGIQYDDNVENFVKKE